MTIVIIAKRGKKSIAVSEAVFTSHGGFLPRKCDVKNTREASKAPRQQHALRNADHTCGKIFDKDICKLFSTIAVLSDSFAARFESPDKDFLIVHEHSIELFNSFDGCFFSFEVDEAITF